REVIYTRRRDLLSRDDLKDDVLELAEGIAEDLIATHADAETASEEWEWKAIDDAVFAQFNFRLNLPEEERAGLRIGALQDLLVQRIRKVYEQRETTFGAPIMRHLEKLIMLQTLDALWKDHLLNMDHLKEGIGLRGYGQVNPLQAYQKEGYDMFEDMIRRMDADVTEKLMSVQLRTEAAGARPLVRVEGMEDEALPAELEAMERRQRQTARVTLSHGGPAAPVKTARRRVAGGRLAGVLVHAGNANACTGAEGLRTAEVSTARAARLLGCHPAEVAPCATGRIGVQVDRPRLLRGVRLAVAA